MKKLFLMFSQVRIPSEMLTHQGTLFISQLMADLCGVLLVKQHCTSVNHHQTDGQVESYN